MITSTKLFAAAFLLHVPAVAEPPKQKPQLGPPKVAELKQATSETAQKSAVASIGEALATKRNPKSEEMSSLSPDEMHFRARTRYRFGPHHVPK